jgi:hypothetical protein
MNDQIQSLIDRIKECDGSGVNEKALRGMLAMHLAFLAEQAGMLRMASEAQRVIGREVQGEAHV